jgi:hypothetical protein
MEATCRGCGETFYEDDLDKGLCEDCYLWEGRA